MNFFLVGQQNVGKSSIYNILTNKNINIIHPSEGTTRDWHFSKIYKNDGMIVYDSPGLIYENKKINLNKYSSIFSKINIFLYVVDYNDPFNLIDKEILLNLRKFNKEIILIINKDDTLKKENDFNSLGIDNKFYVSCSHKLGFYDFNKYISFYRSSVQLSDEYDFSLAIFGKPNAGKSTLLNNILGYKRSVTSKIAGTTSDIVEDFFLYKRKKFKILDTAGILQKSKIDKKTINYLAIKNTLNNISKVDLSLLVLDSLENFDRQNKRIFNLLINKSTSVLIIFNKIDLIKNKKEYYQEAKFLLKNDISLTKNISFILISAKKNNDIKKIKDFIYLKSNKLIKNFPTNKINNWLKNATRYNQHPLVKGKVVNFKYATQISNKPIKIKIFCNYPSNIKTNYKGYLVNDFATKFKILDRKIILIFSSTKNPYS